MGNVTRSHGITGRCSRTAAILLLWTVFLPQAAQCVFTGETVQDTNTYAAGRLLVKFAPTVASKMALGRSGGVMATGIAQVDTLHQSYQVRSQRRLLPESEKSAPVAEKGLSRVWVLEMPPETDVKKMASAYRSADGIEYAEPDYRMNLFDIPNDRLFPHQWYLNNTGQGYFGVDRRPGNYNDAQVLKHGTLDADLDAPEAFEANHVKTLPLVGIIDTGFDLDHEDLTGRIWVNPGEDLNGNGVIDATEENGVDDDHNGFPDDFYGWDFSGEAYLLIRPDNDPTDYYGHGTHCAGIVAGVGNNALGIHGVNTSCRLMAVKFGPNMLISTAVQSIIYAADMGCDVINMSWGMDFPSQALEDALDYAVSRGTLPVAASGNSGHLDNPIAYPAAYPQVFTVGASNSDDEVTYFSSYGNHVDVVSPGEDILSLRADDLDPYGTEGGASGKEPGVHVVADKYYLMDGTSMASPGVVGVAAYIMAVSPGLSIARVKDIIVQSADDVLYPYGPQGPYYPGKDVYSGYGRVNLSSALSLLSRTLARIDSPTENQIVSGDIAVVGTAMCDSIQSFTLDYAAGHTPHDSDYLELFTSASPVFEDTLYVWNTQELTGAFTLRLKVGDEHEAAVRLLANNGADVRIIFPEEGATIVGFADVFGSTILPGFSHYTLDFGVGDSPPAWTTITTSTKMIFGHKAGSWLSSILEEGYYTLRLTAVDTSGERLADSTLVFVENVVSHGWAQDLGYDGSLSPAVGDVDGDLHDEIVFGLGRSRLGDGGGLYVFSHEGELESGWPKDTNLEMNCSPALADLDFDGINDIVICSKKGIHAYLSGTTGWFNQVETHAQYWDKSTPVVADLEGDGSLEVLLYANTSDDTNCLYAWRSDGTPVVAGSGGVFSRTVANERELGCASIAAADLDNDGESEVIAAAGYPTYWNKPVFPDYYEGVGGIYIWDKDGNPLLTPDSLPDSVEFVWSYGLAVADIDDSRDLEIIVVAATNSCPAVYAFKMDGSILPGYPLKMEDVHLSWYFVNHPAVGDLDEDGRNEIVVSVFTTHEGRIYAWHHDATPLSSSGPLVMMGSPEGETISEAVTSLALGRDIAEVSAAIESLDPDQRLALLSSAGVNANFTTTIGTFGSPTLADVNSDGRAEIVVRAGSYFNSSHQRLFAWDHEGNSIPGFPVYASGEASLFSFRPHSPVMADLDHNGRLDIALLASSPESRQVLFWEFDAVYNPSDMAWPKYRHDEWNSGRHGFEFVRDSTSGPPVNLHVAAWTDSSVTLGWTPRPPWASIGYNLYRSCAPGDNGERLNDRVIPRERGTYEDFGYVQGKVRHYRIASVDAEGQESEHSTEIEVLVGKPSPTTGLAAHVQTDSVTLTWQPNPPDEHVALYHVFRKGPDDVTSQLIARTAQTTYWEVRHEPPGLYLYHVTAVNEVGTEGNPHEPVSVPLGSTLTDLQVQSWTSSSVTVRWRVTVDGDGCNVYRSLAPGFPDGPCLNDASMDDPLDSWVAYEDTGLTEGTTYYYHLTHFIEGTEHKPPQQLTFLAGKPHVPQLDVISRQDSIILLLSSPDDTDIKGYRIRRMASKGVFRILDSLCTDTVFVDTTVSEGTVYYYRVSAVDTLDLESSQTPPVDGRVVAPTTVPTTFTLRQNYPNPFNQGTTITFELREPVHVRLEVFNLLGQRVATIVDQELEAGLQVILWEGQTGTGNRAASGTYFYRLTAGDLVQTKKMVLLK